MNEILKFEPYFKSVIWGGKRIAEFKGIESQGDTIGESWELSPMPGHESIVANGSHKGDKLNDLISRYGNDIMGRRLMERFNGNFPLLIKLIDSADDLSVQVHPDDELAEKRHNSLGKTEMWYSVAPADDAYLYAGFSKKIDAEEFRKEVSDNTIIGSLRKYYTKPGDVFYLPAGRVHSIGRGNFVLEIQEASDITYRIYDYDRRDAHGNPRQLHVEESVDAINFDDVDDITVPNVQAAKGETKLLAESKYFTTELIGVDGTQRLELSGRDSFTVLICTKGSLTVDNGEQKLTLSQGETALVPAVVSSIVLGGKGDLVSVYVP